MNIKRCIMDAVAESVWEHKALAVAAIKVLSALDIQESTAVPTAGVTAKALLVNREWFTSLGEKEQIGLVYHEVMHLLLRHAGRGRGKSREIWNIAADIEINELLSRCGFRLPAGGQRAESYGLPLGLLAEDYYKLLCQQANINNQQQEEQDGAQDGDQDDDQESGQGSGQGSGQKGKRRSGQRGAQEGSQHGAGLDVHGKVVHEGNRALTDTDGEEHAEDVFRRIASELAGKLAGTGSFELAKALNHALAIGVCWQEILREYLRQAVGGRMKRTFMRPSARTQVCWPVVRARVLWEDARVLVLVDQSASMDDDLVQRALAEVDRIAAVATVYYSAVDTEPTPPERVYKVVSKTRRKRGGTCFDSAFKLVEEVRADVLVVITDGYVEWPPEPNVPVIVVLVADGAAPRYSRCKVVRAER